MKNIFLQAAAGSGFGNLFYFLIVIAITVVLFIVFRNLILWYYKIDVISKNIQEQTEIQRAILRKLESFNDDQKGNP
ncbi:hypothetical protein [Sphingobacterium sp. UBA6320]|uniref:hypothetical protein n=1 Tax=Sphingobacterium sp. UBA6320 TaxID=1947510 RepID=UPI0025D16A54|nr:hypothetical protein [Sphingobacterium sp. UBA6320]